MILDGKIGTAAQVSRVRQCSRGKCVCGACRCCHGSQPATWLASHWASANPRSPTADVPTDVQRLPLDSATPRRRACACTVSCAAPPPPSLSAQPTLSNQHPFPPALPGRQLSKAQQDKAAAEAARKKKGEAAKARAAEAARQKAVEAAAAGKDQTGEMDGRMLSALITGGHCAGRPECSAAGGCGRNPLPHPHQLPARVHACAAAEQRRPATRSEVASTWDHVQGRPPCRSSPPLQACGVPSPMCPPMRLSR